MDPSGPLPRSMKILLDPGRQEDRSVRRRPADPSHLLVKEMDLMMIRSGPMHHLVRLLPRRRMRLCPPFHQTRRRHQKDRSNQYYRRLIDPSLRRDPKTPYPPSRLPVPARLVFPLALFARYPATTNVWPKARQPRSPPPTPHLTQATATSFAANHEPLPNAPLYRATFPKPVGISVREVAGCVTSVLS